jgi:hypothetical protein
MVGLVAAGVVMVTYSAVHLALGGWTRSVCVPAWWSMWGLCVIPLRIAGTAILMTVNDPVLPRDVRKRFVGAWAEIQIGEWSLKPLWAEERDGAYDRR